MVKAFAWMLCVMVACVGAACSYQEGACWAPGEDPSLGAGGGPVLPPGHGGFGLEDAPEADSQDAGATWTCEGAVTDCTNMKDPHVRRCLYMDGVGATKDAAIAQMKLKCSEALYPLSGMSYICENVDDLTCEEAPVPKWSCSGTARCKRGNRCWSPDEVWHNACSYTDAPVYDIRAEDARQQLLIECQDELNESAGNGPWFCMPGTIQCKRDE